MAARGISLEWRTLLGPEDVANRHDRWLRTDDRLWNVPPLTSILTGKYGSVVRDENKVPLDDWWLRGTDLADAADPAARRTPVAAA